MSDSKYFTPTNTVTIGSPIVRNRFVFVDNNGLSTSVASAPGYAPLGIYYYSEIPTTHTGYAQYYNLGQSIPVWLELASACTAAQLLSYDVLGRGVPVTSGQAYAQAQQGGAAGDYIRVVMGVFAVVGAFSHGFSSGFNGGI